MAALHLHLLRGTVLFLETSLLDYKFVNVAERCIQLIERDTSTLPGHFKQLGEYL